jgi:hypothetical protein
LVVVDLRGQPIGRVILVTHTTVASGVDSVEARAARQLDAQPIGLQCGRCQHPFVKTLGWVRSHERASCPACRAELSLDNSRLIASFENALRDLSRLRASLAPDVPIELKF